MTVRDAPETPRSTSPPSTSTHNNEVQSTGEFIVLPSDNNKSPEVICGLGRMPMAASNPSAWAVDTRFLWVCLP